ncbi:hypothetical protein [Yersinia enterocolitica]|uniref:Uncharacterized protein n=1 Tax=Yersinia enterocolitica TaxID=630 RepID=A0ABP1YBE4_YEREN|nr:hypothetical protein [Yersinia enterocolitica]CNE17397.1 Uncharacterised protein [Yersinia enterocolitica]CQD70817.1 Uncharacterised protein [Yersinia enterocolitica]CRX90863.1 Uncharacterised protein [Yersinia enterocolitica]
MTITTATEDFSAIVTVRLPTGNFDTSNFFSTTSTNNYSPIDEFLTNAVSLNMLWVTNEDEISNQLANLLLLGYVSAVESYMRSMIRSLINIDLFVQKKCESLQVSYTAAMHHTKFLLPEALLEETVFSGKDKITTSLNKFLDMSKLTGSLGVLLDRYESICQMRHCCVHRFGKLGVKNAIALGLEGHKSLIEKPVILNRSDLSQIADSLFSLVKSINNEVFAHVLQRFIGPNKTNFTWNWDYGTDKVIFNKYYKIFQTKEDAIKSPTALTLYIRFKNTKAPQNRR